jgi:uncharacterized protein YkwD
MPHLLRRNLAITIHLIIALTSVSIDGWNVLPREAMGAYQVPAYNGCGGETPTIINGAYEQQVVELVNEARAEQNLPPYKRVDALDIAARYHATDMGQDNYFSHDSYDRDNGELVKVCDWDERVSSYYTNWSSLAENIAAGYSDPQQVMDGWMGSSGHRANILSQSNWEIGVGYFDGGGDYGRYWVQDFGRQSGSYPLIINAEAADTDSRTVTIYIYGNWQEMRLQNDGGEWTDWEPFSHEFSWVLDGGAGIHDVAAQMRNGDVSVTSDDAINLTVDDVAILNNVPGGLDFFYSIPDGKNLADWQQVTLDNVGGDASITWEITSQGDWFNADPLTGSTPGTFTVSLADFPKEHVATFTGTLTVTATSPVNTQNAPQVILLNLHVVDNAFHAVYLPVVKR